MYSQNDEEKYIVEALASVPNGRFLDIGAYDGKLLSNTYRLSELGWSGVCVEPSPVPFASLLGTHGANPKIQLINCAIVPGIDFKFVPFYNSPEGSLSTTSTDHVKKWQSVVPTFNPFTAVGVPPSVLLRLVGPDFDMVSIDVESTNLELFCSFPFETLSHLKLVCIEHDGHHEIMRSELGRLGFKEIALNGENLIMHHPIDKP